MNKISSITPSFAVTGALQLADFAELAKLGFKSVVSNLPDGEQPGYPSAAQEAEAAKAAGLAFRHIPTTKFDLFTDRVAGGMLSALTEMEGPVLAHCASGLRSAAVWGIAASRVQGSDKVLATLAKAGFNLTPLQDELREQGGEKHAGAIPAPLDAGTA